MPAPQRNAALAHQDAGQARLTASALLDAFGPDRLVWGSDWPHTRHQDLVDFARSRALLDGWIPSAVNAAAYWWTHQPRFFALARS